MPASVIPGLLEPTVWGEGWDRGVKTLKVFSSGIIEHHNGEAVSALIRDPKE